MRNAPAVVTGELRLVAVSHRWGPRRPRHVPSWTPIMNISLPVIAYRTKYPTFDKQVVCSCNQRPRLTCYQAMASTLIVFPITIFGTEFFFTDGTYILFDTTSSF